MRAILPVGHAFVFAHGEKNDILNRSKILQHSQSGDWLARILYYETYKLSFQAFASKAVKIHAAALASQGVVSSTNKGRFHN